MQLGEHGTAASGQEYARVLAEWEANGRRLPPTSAEGSAHGLSVNELILAYWSHVETYYRHADGTPTSEVMRHPPCPSAPQEALRSHASRGLRYAGPRHAARPDDCRGVVPKPHQQGHRRASSGCSNGPALASWFPPKCSSAYRPWKACGPADRSARDAPVKPVPEEWVRQTLPFLRPQVAAIVELQWLTGMRPGEVTIMRTIDLDMTGKVWLYRPGSDQGTHGRHKTAHRGQTRVVLIGPKAQQVLRPWLRLNLTEYLFQPREAREQFDAERRAKCKSKVTPSQAARKRKKKPKRTPGNRYRVSSYDHAIMVACDTAFPPPPPLAQREDETNKQWPERIGSEGWEEVKQWRREHRWHPHQLRHAKATEIRREAGLDAARAVLGHRTPAVTEVYAELDVAKAAAIMEKLG